MYQKWTGQGKGANQLEMKGWSEKCFEECDIERALG